MPLPVPLHLGALHAYEQALVLLVAFGPFVVLGVVVAVQRRRAVAEERAEQQTGQQTGQQAGQQTGQQAGQQAAAAARADEADPETESG